MWKLANLIKSIFKNKPASVFISNSPSCPCLHTYDIIKNIKGVNSINIQETDSLETSNKLIKIKQYPSILVFCHGDKRKLEFFYKSLTNTIEKNIYIQNLWWSKWERKERITYFHVCSGAAIIRGNAILKNIFTSWVSYSADVYGFFSQNAKIIDVNKKFLKQATLGLSKNSKPEGLKTFIEKAYKDLQIDIYQNNAVITGYTAIIASIGKNISCLESS